MTKVARVDHEYNAVPFWNHFLERAEQLAHGTELHSHCLELLGRSELILHSEDAAAELLAFCKAIPGYTDGPEYAREAVTIEDAVEY